MSIAGATMSGVSRLLTKQRIQLGVYVASGLALDLALQGVIDNAYVRPGTAAIVGALLGWAAGGMFERVKAKRGRSK
ncbi:MAG: hypothetical protein LBK95_09015 [Bifidobacteriaceae bacterium]|jgi:hypothetical protein|nr:hypothetical protein [Bifidobacteriaceae bacterium]